MATHIYIFVATSGSISSLQLYSPLMRDNFHRDEYKCSKEAERNYLCSLHLLFVCHRVTVNPGAIRTCAGAGRVKSPQLLLFTKLDVDYFCTPRPLLRAAASPHVRGSRTFLAFSSRAAEASWLLRHGWAGGRRGGQLFGGCAERSPDVSGTFIWTKNNKCGPTWQKQPA